MDLFGTGYHRKGIYAHTFTVIYRRFLYIYTHFCSVVGAMEQAQQEREEEIKAVSSSGFSKINISMQIKIKICMFFILFSLQPNQE